MWGREAVLPMDVAYGVPTRESTVHDHLRTILENIRQAHTIATKTLHHSREVQKKYYDPGKEPYKFQEGGTVWCYLPMQAQGRSPTLQSFWTGPWELIQRMSHVVWAIETEKKKKKAHGAL